MTTLRSSVPKRLVFHRLLGSASTSQTFLNRMAPQKYGTMWSRMVLNLELRSDPQRV